MSSRSPVTVEPTPSSADIYPRLQAPEPFWRPQGHPGGLALGAGEGTAELREAQLPRDPTQEPSIFFLMPLELARGPVQSHRENGELEAADSILQRDLRNHMQCENIFNAVLLTVIHL